MTYPESAPPQAVRALIVLARLLGLAVLAGFWSVWLVQQAFPFGGGEAHWVTRHGYPLSLTNGLFLGGVYMAAGVSLAVVLRVMRTWVTVVTAIVVPNVSYVVAAAIIGGAPSPFDSSALDRLGDVAFSVLPMLGVGLIAMQCRRGVSWILVSLVSWWPGALQLPGYVLESAFPARFRLGVGLMWLAGGLAVFAASGLGTKRTACERAARLAGMSAGSSSVAPHARLRRHPT